MEEQEAKEREDIHSTVVRAGKRTYFFDIRSTRKEDFYLTITESKRHYNNDGTFYYKKHKIFLYKEDFEKFSDAFSESFKKIIELTNSKNHNLSDKVLNQFSDIKFEDLGEEVKSED